MTRRIRRLSVALGAVALAVASLPVDVYAGDPSLPGASPAIRQYIEMIPTASGSVAAGGGRGEVTIPATTQKKIERGAGKNADLLKKVVAARAYGAPAQFSAPPSPASAATTTTTASQPSKPSTRPSSNRTAERQPAAPAQVVVTAPLPAEPSRLSAAFGTNGIGGALFLIALACAVGLSALPRLARR